MMRAHLKGFCLMLRARLAIKVVRLASRLHYDSTQAEAKRINRKRIEALEKRKADRYEKFQRRSAKRWLPEYL